MDDFLITDSGAEQIAPNSSKAIENAKFLQKTSLQTFFNTYQKIKLFQKQRRLIYFEKQVDYRVIPEATPSVVGLRRYIDIRYMHPQELTS